MPSDPDSPGTSTDTMTYDISVWITIAIILLI